MNCQSTLHHNRNGGIMFLINSKSSSMKRRIIKSDFFWTSLLYSFPIMTRLQFFGVCKTNVSAWMVLHAFSIWNWNVKLDALLYAEADYLRFWDVKGLMKLRFWSLNA